MLTLSVDFQHSMKSIIKTVSGFARFHDGPAVAMVAGPFGGPASAIATAAASTSSALSAVVSLRDEQD